MHQCAVALEQWQGLAGSRLAKHSTLPPVFSPPAGDGLATHLWCNIYMRHCLADKTLLRLSESSTNCERKVNHWQLQRHVVEALTAVKHNER